MISFTKQDILSIISLIPQTPTTKLIQDILHTEIDIKEILNCNPVLTQILINYILEDSSTITYIHEMLRQGIYFSKQHKKKLIEILRKGFLEESKILQVGIYLINGDIEFIKFLFDIVSYDERFSVYGVELINKVFMQKSIKREQNRINRKLFFEGDILEEDVGNINNTNNIHIDTSKKKSTITFNNQFTIFYHLISTNHILLNDILIRLIHTHTDLIHYFRIKLYHIIHDTNIYIEIYKHKIFRKDFFNILDTVNDKTKFLLNIKISKRCIKDIIQYDIQDTRVYYKLLKRSNNKKWLIDFIYERDLHKKSTKLSLLMISALNKKGLLKKYKFKRRHIEMIISKENIYINKKCICINKSLYNSLLNTDVNNDYIDNINYNYFNDTNILYNIIQIGDNIIKYILLDKPVDISYINQYTINISKEKDLIFYLFKFSLYIKQVDLIERIVEKDLFCVSEYIMEYIEAGGTIDPKIILKNTNIPVNILNYMIKDTTIVFDILQIVKRYNTDLRYMSIFKHIERQSIVEHIQYILSILTDKNKEYILVNIYGPEDKIVLECLLYIKKNIFYKEYILEGIEKYAIVSKYIVLFLDISYKYKYIPYVVLRNKMTYKTYRKILKISYMNINNKKFIIEYLKYMPILDREYYKVIYKIIDLYNKDRNIKKSCYNILVNQINDMYIFNKVIILLRNELRLINCKEYDIIYFILEKIQEIKNIELISKLKADLIMCIGEDSGINEYVKNILKYYYKGDV